MAHEKTQGTDDLLFGFQATCLRFKAQTLFGSFFFFVVGLGNPAKNVNWFLVCFSVLFAFGGKGAQTRFFLLGGGWRLARGPGRLGQQGTGSPTQGTRAPQTQGKERMGVGDESQKKKFARRFT